MGSDFALSSMISNLAGKTEKETLNNEEKTKMRILSFFRDLKATY